MQTPTTHDPSSFMKNSSFWTDLSRLAFKLPPDASPTYDAQRENFSDAPEIKKIIRDELISSLKQPYVEALELAYKQEMINHSAGFLLHNIQNDIYINVSRLPDRTKASIVSDEAGGYRLETQCGLSYLDARKFPPATEIPGKITHYFTINPDNKEINFDRLTTSNSVLAKFVSGNPIDQSNDAIKQSLAQAKKEEEKSLTQAKKEAAQRYLVKISNPETIPSTLEPGDVAQALTELYRAGNDGPLASLFNGNIIEKRYLLEDLMTRTLVKMPDGEARLIAFKKFLAQFITEDDEILFSNLNIYAQHLLTVNKGPFTENPLQEFINACTDPRTIQKDLSSLAHRTCNTLGEYILSATGSTVSADTLNEPLRAMILYAKIKNPMAITERIATINKSLSEKESTNIQERNNSEKAQGYSLNALLTALNARFDIGKILPLPHQIADTLKSPQKQTDLAYQLITYMQDYKKENPGLDSTRPIEEILIRALTREGYQSGEHYSREYFTNLNKIIESAKDQVSVEKSMLLTEFQKSTKDIKLVKPIEDFKLQFDSLKARHLAKYEQLRQLLIEKLENETAGKYTGIGGYKVTSPITGETKKYPKNAATMLAILHKSEYNWLIQLSAHTTSGLLSTDSKPRLRNKDVHTAYTEIQTTITETTRLYNENSTNAIILTKLKNLEKSARESPRPPLQASIDLELNKMRTRYTSNENTPGSYQSDLALRSGTLSSDNESVSSCSTTPFRNTSPSSSEVAPNTPNSRGPSRNL